MSCFSKEAFLVIGCAYFGSALEEQSAVALSLTRNRSAPCVNVGGSSKGTQGGTESPREFGDRIKGDLLAQEEESKRLKDANRLEQRLKVANEKLDEATKNNNPELGLVEGAAAMNMLFLAQLRQEKLAEATNGADRTKAKNHTMAEASRIRAELVNQEPEDWLKCGAARACDFSEKDVGLVRQRNPV